jgi:hypothetical protein
VRSPAPGAGEQTLDGRTQVSELYAKIATQGKSTRDQTARISLAFVSPGQRSAFLGRGIDQRGLSQIIRRNRRPYIKGTAQASCGMVGEEQGCGLAINEQCLQPTWLGLLPIRPQPGPSRCCPAKAVLVASVLTLGQLCCKAEHAR